MKTVTRRRWLRALHRLWAIERISPHLAPLGRPRRISCARRFAWSTPHAHQALRRSEQPAELEFQPPTVTSADGVLIGKFDVGHEVRMRAFYLDDGLTARFQSGGKVNGISRSLEAFRALARQQPGLMPGIVDNGHTPSGAYLVEQTLPGRPARPWQLSKFAGAIADRLITAQAAHGIDKARLSTIVHRDFLNRWHAAAELIDLSAGIRSTVVALVARDHQLDVSMIHGDLVASNVLISDDDFSLIDWEYATSGPIAFDLAKLEINADRPNDVRRAVLTALEGRLGTQAGGYTVREQLALGHVQVISWHAARLERAIAAGREAHLTANTRARVEAIETLLEL